MSGDDIGVEWAENGTSWSGVASELGENRRVGVEGR